MSSGVSSCFIKHLFHPPAQHRQEIAFEPRVAPQPGRIPPRRVRQRDDRRIGPAPVPNRLGHAAVPAKMPLLGMAPDQQGQANHSRGCEAQHGGTTTAPCSRGHTAVADPAFSAAGTSTHARPLELHGTHCCVGVSARGRRQGKGADDVFCDGTSASREDLSSEVNRLPRCWGGSASAVDVAGYGRAHTRLAHALAVDKPCPGTITVAGSSYCQAWTSKCFYTHNNINHTNTHKYQDQEDCNRRIPEIRVSLFTDPVARGLKGFPPQGITKMILMSLATLITMMLLNNNNTQNDAAQTCQ